MFFHVYVLQSLQDLQFYVGKSKEVFRRLKQHNNGLNISTRKRRPLRLVYIESFLHKEDASRRERYFKTTKGRTTLRQMLRSYLDQIQQMS